MLLMFIFPIKYIYKLYFICIMYVCVYIHIFFSHSELIILFELH